MVWTVRPQARKPSAMLLPRLRSMKNSGGASRPAPIVRRRSDAAGFRREGLRRRPRGDTNHVFDLLDRDAEVVSDLRDAVPGLEAIDEILDLGAPVSDE